MADVNVTYEDMRQAGNRLKQEYEQMDAKLDELQSYIQGLVSDGYVTGRSSGAFDDQYQQFTTGAKQMLQGLEGLGSFLIQAADTFEQTDEGLASGISG
ncbi:WXG100 family type VII secretion target [Streptomyces hoynatensis]|uniref:ESAT-6-like protein n=1 Tax=Streptomyces hoynatensis TaxID=1141874 RepID=A0A3A9ZFF7_9ACTN|nr:WXG100 family type VII secretion target [Streptomyces hoynatensis]RKN47192.1 WXG100 family type VII secretion target [Streptomyces hoynatensis]